MVDTVPRQTTTQRIREGRAAALAVVLSSAILKETEDLRPR